MPLDDAEGHVAATLLAPFPPGMPWLVPGERFDGSIVRSLQVLRAFNRSFPGLGVSVQGLISDGKDEDEWLLGCVRRRRTPLRPMAPARFGDCLPAGSSTTATARTAPRPATASDAHP